jgi:hypothetical protein
MPKKAPEPEPIEVVQYLILGTQRGGTIRAPGRQWKVPVQEWVYLRGRMEDG